MTPDEQDMLSKRMYKDFVVFESKDILSKLLERTVFMQVTEDAQQSAQMLRDKQAQVSRLCPTLFSPLESQILLGMNLVQNATRETDQERRDEMVRRAFDLLSADPDKIDIERIVPMLAKIRMLSQIVQVCVLKIRKAMASPERAEEIADLLEVVVQVVEALDRGITEDNFDSVYDQGFQAAFAKAVKELRFDYRAIVLEQIISQLAESDVRQCIEHLLRAFLVKGRNVDFICKEVSAETIAAQCQTFVHEQSKADLLTDTQWACIVRLLSKERRADELA